MALLSLKVTAAVSVNGSQVGSATVQSTKLTVPTTVGLTLFSGAGPQGATGATGPPGVGANWRGIWSAIVTYAIGDGVTGSDGHEYIGLTAGNLNHNPVGDGGVHWSDLIPSSVISASSGSAYQIPVATGSSGWTWQNKPVYDIRDYLAGGSDARVAVAGAVAAAVSYITGNSAPAAVYIPSGIWQYQSSVTKAALGASIDSGGGAGAFSNQGVPLPVNLPALLEIRFEEGAQLQLASTAHNAFYVDKQADFDVFQHVHFHDACIDNNQQTGRCHILIGNMPEFQTKQRYLSYNDIHFYGKTKVLNVPIDQSQTVSNKVAVAFWGDHNGALEQIWQLVESGAPTGGTFTLTFSCLQGTVTTGTIAYNASAATVASTVQTALQTLVASATCTATGGPINTTPVYITFTGVILNVSITAVSANVGSLTGGSSPTVTPTMQTYSTDIDIHDIEQIGGDGVVNVASTVATRCRPGGTNHYYDRILVRRWRHTKNVIPTGQIFQTSVYVCGAGFGEYFEIGPGYSENIADDVFEIGAMQSGVIEAPRMKNAYLEGILFRHTHAAINPSTQKIRVHGLRLEATSAMTQRATNYNTTPLRFYMDDGIFTLTETGSPTGGTFTVSVVTTNGTAATANIAFGATAATIASSIQTALQALPSSSSATCTATGGPINTTPVTITLGNVNLLSATGGSVVFANNGGLTGGSSPQVNAVLSLNSPVLGAFLVEDAQINIDGMQYTKCGMTDLFVRGLDQPVRRLELLRPAVYLSNYTYDNSSSGDLAMVHPLSFAGTAWPQTVNIKDMDVIFGSGCNFNAGGFQARVHMVAPEGQHTQTNIDGLETDWSGATSASGIFLMVGVGHNGGSSQHVIARGLKPRAVAPGSSNTGMRVYSGGGSILYVLMEESDFTEASGFGGNELVNSIANGLVRAYGNQYATKPAPTTLTGLVSTTGKALTAAYDQIVQFVQGSGTAITAIDYSTDGGSHYTNLLAQASGALPAGFDTSLGPLPPNSLIKVTFATTQPTINLVPANP